jgi:hypothetical protein
MLPRGSIVGLWRSARATEGRSISPAGITLNSIDHDHVNEGRCYNCIIRLKPKVKAAPVPALWELGFQVDGFAQGEGLCHDRYRECVEVPPVTRPGRWPHIWAPAHGQLAGNGERAMMGDEHPEGELAICGLNVEARSSGHQRRGAASLISAAIWPPSGTSTSR